MMLHVGLTGGVGAGKSAVAALFAELGAHVLDADQLSREVTAPGSEGLAAVVAAFGNGVLHAQGGLDRAALGSAVFGDNQALARLEAILHPRIRDLEQQRVRTIADESPEAVVVYEAALLLESGGDAGVDRMAVVDAPPELQWQRARARGDRGSDQIRTMLERQLSRPRRLARADDIIDNGGPWAATRARVRGLYDYYQAWARQRAVAR